MKAVSLLFHGCWVLRCSTHKAHCVPGTAGCRSVPITPGAAAQRAGMAEQCLHLLKHKHVGEWPLLRDHNAALFITLRKEKNCNEKARYQLHPWEEKNKGWVKLRHKTWASCGTSQTSLYILAVQLYPAWVFTFKSIKSCHKCFRLCWQRSGQKGGLCVASVLFFFEERSTIQNWVCSFQCSLLKIGKYGFFWLCNWLC